MSNNAIVGINWGDEGKGRMVDLLTADYDVVVRYQGGGNAGHTVINEYGKFALRRQQTFSWLQNILKESVTMPQTLQSGLVTPLLANTETIRKVKKSKSLRKIFYIDFT